MFVSAHGIRRPRVSPMGDVLGFDLAEVAIAAQCVGFEMGEHELRLVEVLEEEWRETIRVRRGRAEDEEVETDEDEDDAE